DIVVADDCQINFLVNSAFGAVIFGNVSGANGKTLTFHDANANPSDSRVRLTGLNTVCNANITCAESTTTLASYNGTGTQVYNGVISGSQMFMEKGGITIFNGANTYSGGTVPAQGVMGLGVDTVGSPSSITSGPLGTGPI